MPRGGRRQGAGRPRALDDLERALNARGHRGEDLDLILVSHQHMDHVGLVDILPRRVVRLRARREEVVEPDMVHVMLADEERVEDFEPVATGVQVPLQIV